MKYSHLIVLVFSLIVTSCISSRSPRLNKEVRYGLRQPVLFKDEGITLEFIESGTVNQHSFVFEYRKYGISQQEQFVEATYIDSGEVILGYFTLNGTNYVIDARPHGGSINDNRLTLWEESTRIEQQNKLFIDAGWEMVDHPAFGKAWKKK